MNPNLDKIIVIHPSEIILQGFSAIFSEFFLNEILLIKHPDNLYDYPHLSGEIIILISDEYYPLFKNKIDRLLTNCTVKYIEIKSGNHSKTTAEAIHINESKSSIVTKIKQSALSFKSHSNKGEDSDLSKRELDVLKLLTKGYSNKEIADKLFISTHTVISHRKNLSEKTGIRSASGLTMYAVLKKIIDIDDISTSDLI